MEKITIEITKEQQASLLDMLRQVRVSLDGVSKLQELIKAVSTTAGSEPDKK